VIKVSAFVLSKGTFPAKTPMRIFRRKSRTNLIRNMKDKIIDLISRFWFVLLILFCCIVLSIKFASGRSLEIEHAARLMEVDQTNKF
jgi:hypothetical protein